MLLDEGSFLEIDMFRQSQTVAAPTGTSTDRRGDHWIGYHLRPRVFMYAQDFRVLGGSLARCTPPRSTR